MSATERRLRGAMMRGAVVLKGSTGLALAYLGWPLATAGDVCDPRETFLEDGASLVTLVPLVLLLIVLHHRGDGIGATARHRLSVAGIVAEAGALAALGILRLMGLCGTEARFWLCVVLAAATVVAVAFWLERASGSSMGTAATLVFAALALNVAMLYVLSFVPDAVRSLIACALTLGQLLCARLSDRLPADIAWKAGNDDYYAYMRAGEANRRFLVACALGIAGIALVAGFLCGFPDDRPRTLGALPRALCFVLTEVLCIAVIVIVRKRQNRMMTVGIWVIMELLAGLALVLYNAVPGHWEAGCIAAQMLNVVMCGMVWHFTIALMDTGWRDPLYYAVVAWLLWIGPHDVGRILLVVLPIGGSSHFTGALISLFLLISTQIILVKLIDVGRFAERGGNAACDLHGIRSTVDPLCCPSMEEPRQDFRDLSRGEEEDDEGRNACDADNPPDWGRDARLSPLERFLGLDEQMPDDAPLRVMRRRAQRMGELFLLSDREVEVLALYALGHTQKRVAEELYISPTTTHTHISRIYAKTNLHSRQELLDFMREFGD